VSAASGRRCTSLIALALCAARAPIVAGEFGELDCVDAPYQPLLSFAELHGISQLAWAWFVGSCAREPSLIDSYAGSPAPSVIGVKRHLATFAGSAPGR
jgi:endoglucanase